MTSLTEYLHRDTLADQSIVNIIARRGDVLEIKGIDVLDNTPLIDIKPYIPRFDIVSDASNGWVASKQWRPKPQGRE